MESPKNTDYYMDATEMFARFTEKYIQYYGQVTNEQAAPDKEWQAEKSKAIKHITWTTEDDWFDFTKEEVDELKPLYEKAINMPKSDTWK